MLLWGFGIDLISFVLGSRLELNLLTKDLPWPSSYIVIMLLLINKGKNITPIGGLIDQLDVTPYSTIDGDTSAKDYLMKP